MWPFFVSRAGYRPGFCPQSWGTVSGFVTIPEIIGAGVLLLAVFLFLQGRRQGKEPLLNFLIFKDRNGFDTGVQVQNVDSTDAQVRITYRLASGATAVEFAVVPAGGSHTFYQPDNADLPAGSVGSAIVENIGGGQRLVAIVNEVNYARGGDASSTYEGLNY